MNADGSDQVQRSGGTSPSWSPDGTRIAFAAAGGISIMNADGSNPTPFSITSDLATDNISSVKWSPDGTKLAFSRWSGSPGWLIVMVNLDGSRHGVIQAGGNDRFDWGTAPNFSATPPGGTNIIYGTAGNDRLVGTPGRDVIYGGGGNDVIKGLGGNDKLVGGPGRDKCVGGKGKDKARKCEVVRSVP
jgi:Tol biopolymer transport system component